MLTQGSTQCSTSTDDVRDFPRCTAWNYQWYPERSSVFSDCCLCQNYGIQLASLGVILLKQTVKITTDPEHAEGQIGNPSGSPGSSWNKRLSWVQSKKKLLCTMMSVSCHWRVTLIVIYIQVYTHNCASTIPRSTKYSEYSVPRQFGCGSVHWC